MATSLPVLKFAGDRQWQSLISSSMIRLQCQLLFPLLRTAPAPSSLLLDLADSAAELFRHGALFALPPMHGSSSRRYNSLGSATVSVSVLWFALRT